MDKKYVVYQHVTPDELYYFGATSNIKRRWEGNGKGYKGTALQPYIEKFGWDNIKHIVLFRDQTKENALWIENFLIETAREDGVCINKNRSGFVSKEEGYNQDRNQKYYEQNRDKINEQKKQRYEQNRDKIKEQQREYREQNRDKIKQYYEQNRDKINEQKKQYYQQNKDKWKEYQEQNKDKIKKQIKQYREQNRDKISEYQREYREQHKEEFKEYQRKNRDKINEYKRQYRRRKKEEKQLKELGCLPLW